MIRTKSLFFVLVAGWAVLFSLAPGLVLAETLDGRDPYLPYQDEVRMKAVKDSLDGVEAQREKRSLGALVLPDPAPAASPETVVPGPVIPPLVAPMTPIDPEQRSAVVKRTLDWVEFQFDMNSGFRYDFLQFNIAGDTSGQNPNILSELTWKDLWSYQIGTKAQAVFNKHIRVEGSYDYAWIMDGKNQDSDYLGDDRTLEFSRSLNSTDDDNLMDFSVGLGWQFRIGAVKDWEDILTNDLWCALLAGYSYHEQNLRITNGYQDFPPTGAFSGLNSTYQTKWRGPWTGIEFFGQREKFKGYSRLEYHWADYDAEGNWNLRDDFAHPVSFAHGAKGGGINIAFGGKYIVNDSWAVGLDGNLEFWETKDGRDRTYFADGSSSDTKFNEVKWRSYGLMLSATYLFGGK